MRIFAMSFALIMVAIALIPATHAQAPVNAPVYTTFDWWMFEKKHIIYNAENKEYDNQTEVVTVVDDNHDLSVNGSTYSTYGVLTQSNGTYCGKSYSDPLIKYDYTLNTTRYLVKSNLSVAYEQYEKIRYWSPDKMDIERAQVFHPVPVGVFFFPLGAAGSWAANEQYWKSAEYINFNAGGRINNYTGTEKLGGAVTYTSHGLEWVGPYPCINISKDDGSCRYYAAAAGMAVMHNYNSTWNGIWAETERLVTGSFGGNSLPEAPGPKTVDEALPALATLGIAVAAVAVISALGSAERRKD